MAAAMEKVESMTRSKKAKQYAHDTAGFGVPKTLAPHHFVVEIPRGNSQPVLITEDLGVAGEARGHEVLDRVVVPRRNWTEIQAAVKRAFNERLKMHDLATAQWKVGTTPVDRMLGKELCVLAWAIEDMPPEDTPYALRNWLALRPEERWWLFDMVAATVGGPDGKGRGWRMALRYALGDTPEATVRSTRFGDDAKTSSKTTSDPTLGLFTDDKE
ncbi:anti-phage-associated DUF3780 domain-containing protein [Thioalkalivibrio sp. ALMg13-2]|uniref:anti-phage-associated DUF3780 domain-containing protein n=1 Tax=Thioalkalivibrio sp. ALMg13-2 TaxID=1158167 RepID=UPI0003A25D9C|nr:anti-phage-associated DUF3780 domain-containing protein [Thioalkalivibrio sp. ALMg13-2]